MPPPPTLTRTSVTLAAPSSLVQGDVAGLSGRLTAASGAIAGGTVDLTCGDAEPLSVPVAGSGAFRGVVQIPLDQAPGRITCTASFAGGVGLAGSSATRSLTIEVFRTPTPEPSASDETPTPPAGEEAAPTEDESPAAPSPSASPASAGGDAAETTLLRVVLIVGGASTAVATVGGLALLAARGRRNEDDDADVLIGPDQVPDVPGRKLAP